MKKTKSPGEAGLEALRRATTGLCRHLEARASPEELESLTPQGLHQLAVTAKELTAVVRNLNDLPVSEKKPEPVEVVFSGQAGEIAAEMKKQPHRQRGGKEESLGSGSGQAK